MTAAAHQEIRGTDSLSLLAEGSFREGGAGLTLSLGEHRGQLLNVWLEITHVIDSQSLGFSLWGSADGKNWDPLVRFPKKYYCGSYEAMLDLCTRPDVKFVQVRWDVNRWALDGRQPLFTFEAGLRRASENPKSQAGTLTG